MVMAAAGKVPCRNKRTLTRGPRKNRPVQEPLGPGTGGLLSLIKFFINRLHRISQQAVSSGFTVDLR